MVPCYWFGMAIQEATPIALTAAERATLTGWVRSGKTEHRLVERARMVLLAGDGWGSRAIAREVIPFTVSPDPEDAPRPGKPKTYGRGRRSAIWHCSTPPQAAHPPPGTPPHHTSSPTRLPQTPDTPPNHTPLPIPTTLLPRTRPPDSNSQSPSTPPNPTPPPHHPTPPLTDPTHHTKTPTNTSARHPPTASPLGSFTSVAQLRAAIDAFIARYNQHAVPFQWRKAKVHPKTSPHGSWTYDVEY